MSKVPDAFTNPPQAQDDAARAEDSYEAVWVDEDLEETIGALGGYGIGDPALNGFFEAETHESVLVVREPADGEQAPTSSDKSLANVGFVLQRCVGSGGMGEIWEATQQSLKRRIAIKRLRQDLADLETRPDAAQLLSHLFRQEALTTAHLQHPNIVPVHDLGVDEKGNPLLVMKLVRGLRWPQAILKDSALPAAEFYTRHLRILIDVSNAVAFAHSKGIIHRDLKPSQVMIGEFGEVMLMDWGLAAPISRPLADGLKPRDLAVGPSGASISNPAGTPSYMAPEQTQDHPDNLGPWTDVFLLGGMLYYLLTKTAPYNEKNRPQAFQQAVAGRVEPPEIRAPDADIPQELSALAMKAMSFDPKDRVPSALAFVSCLNDYLSGAGHRRESATIVATVVERLGENPKSYAVLAECQVSLARAEGLWSENPETRLLGDRLSEQYAVVALENNDLILAQTQAELVRDKEKRRALVSRVETARKRSAGAARERKLAIAAVLLSLLLLVAGGIEYAKAQMSARRAAESARERARRQRDAAETEQYYYGVGSAGAALEDGREEKALNTLLNGVPPRLRNWEWGCLLANYCSDDMILYKGEPGKELYHASFSPDGKRIVIGQRGGILSMWDAATGARLFQRELHTSGLWAVKFSPDGSKLFLASYDGRGYIANAQSGDVVTTISGHVGNSPSMRGGSFSPDGLRVATSGSDGFVRVWDAQTSAQLLAVRLPHPTYDAAFSPDGTKIAVAMLGHGQAVLCDSSNGSILQTFEGHGKSVLSVRFSSDGRHLLTASRDQKARIFDVETGKTLLEFGHAVTFPNCAAISPDDSLVATGSENGQCRIWDSTSGTLLGTLRAGPEVHGVEFSPDGRKLVTTSVGATKVWSLGSLFPSSVRVNKSDLPATATIDQLRNVSFPYDRNSTWGNNDIAWLSETGRTYLRSIDRWYAVDSYYSVFSPDGSKRIEIGYKASTVTAYDNESSTVLSQLSPKSGFNACFSNDGKLAATGSQNGLLQVWDTSTWRETAEFQGADKTALWSLQFSPDDSLLALGWLNGNVTMWDVKNKKPVYEIKAHFNRKPVVTVAFSADGKRFVTSSSDKTAKVWDTRTGRLISALSGHDKFLIGAVFSPDQTKILTASDDGKVKLWEANTGREIITVYSAPPDTSLLRAAFTKDGKRVFATTSKGELAEIETFPWLEGDYPGTGDVPFEKRLELYKRRVRLGGNIQLGDIGW